MKGRQPNRPRYGDSGERSSYKNIRRRTVDAESEFVPVPGQLKGHVIGKNGSMIKEIKRKSGAEINSKRDQEGFDVSGSEEQRECARWLIAQKVEEVQNWKRRTTSPGELVEIPEDYKGIAIGKGGDNLRRIETETGARLFRQEGEVYVSGTKEQVQQAKLQISSTVVGGRLSARKKQHNVCCYVDSWNLPENCELKLKPVGEKEHMVLKMRSSQAQYRLRLLEECATEESCDHSNAPTYRAKLQEDVLESLRKIKLEMDSNAHLKADMWCHFGTLVILGPDEDEIDEVWSIASATEKFKPSSDTSFWKIAFKEGVDVDEKAFGEQTPEEYIARYDLTFVTPSGREIRCKVWVAKHDLAKKLEEVKIPFRDVKNVVDEVYFEDDAMRSRCRGWLVLPSRKYLQADIIFPGCKFDCRITIRTRTTSAMATDDAPEEEEWKVLSSYLSKATLMEEAPDGLRLPDENIPEGFHLIHRRWSRRTRFRPSEGFSIILSKEKAWRNDHREQDTRESIDLHLHCEEWDQALADEDWDPETIAGKLPDFLAFVQRAQEFVFREIKETND